MTSPVFLLFSLFLPVTLPPGILNAVNKKVPRESKTAGGDQKNIVRCMKPHRVRAWSIITFFPLPNWPLPVFSRKYEKGETK